MGYSKNKLKRMFLKVLYEIQFGSMKSHSNGTDTIIPRWINEKFNINLTPEDEQLAQEAVQDLKTTGLIVKDATQRSDTFVVLTSKGKEIVEKDKDPDIHGLQLDQMISNAKLLSKCSHAFNNDDYETAIFSAYKFVEEAVRSKAELYPNDFGVPLMTKALHPDHGKLIFPSCALPAEQEGIYNLFKGVIAFFKNPSSHRTVNFSDRLVAIKIIALADLLLQILSTAQPRS